MSIYRCVFQWQLKSHWLFSEVDIDVHIPLMPACWDNVCWWLREGVLEEGVSLLCHFLCLLCSHTCLLAAGGWFPGFVSVRGMVKARAGGPYKQFGDENIINVLWCSRPGRLVVASSWCRTVYQWWRTSTKKGDCLKVSLSVDTSDLALDGAAEYKGAGQVHSWEKECHCKSTIMCDLSFNLYVVWLSVQIQTLGLPGLMGILCHWPIRLFCRQQGHSHPIVLVKLEIILGTATVGSRFTRVPFARFPFCTSGQTKNKKF